MILRGHEAKHLCIVTFEMFFLQTSSYKCPLGVRTYYIVPLELGGAKLPLCKSGSLAPSNSQGDVMYIIKIGYV